MNLVVLKIIFRPLNVIMDLFTTASIQRTDLDKEEVSNSGQTEPNMKATGIKTWPPEKGE